MASPILYPNLTIGGVLFDGKSDSGHGPMPSKLQIDIQDVDFDSGRTADGMMHRNKVAVKYKLEITWPAMDPDGVSRCLQAVMQDSFSVSFLNPLTNTKYTGTFYVGDRAVPVFNYYLGLYDSFSFNVIEY